MTIETKEITPQTIPDFLEFFKRPEFGGCHCMYWEFSGSNIDWSSATPEQLKKRKIEILENQKSSGVLLYKDGKPIGWCQFGKRDYFVKLDKYYPVSEEEKNDIWCITCFCVAKEHRKKKLSKLLLEKAVEILKQKGAKIIEAYPTCGEHPDEEVWTGPLSIFLSSSFKIYKEGELHPVVRLVL